VLVTRRDLESALHELAAEIADPLGGIHGPDSLGWRFGRDLINFIGAGRATLLQLAHPPVARAVESHSRALVDARGRFQRTFATVFAMTFGTLDDATRAARRLHNIHTRITGEHVESLGRYPAGSGYAANDSASLIWVYATLTESVIAVRRYLGRPLPEAIAERYYRESQRFAALFGLRPPQIPASHRELQAYMASALDDGTLAVGEAARSIAAALLEAPSPALEPIAYAYRALTASLLPGDLAAAFDLPRGRRARVAGRALARALDLGIRAMPRPLRYVPGYLDAEARCGRRSGFVRIVDRTAARALMWPVAG
jgi:uncharacterized protein (DUF2236 family)